MSTILLWPPLDGTSFGFQGWMTGGGGFQRGGVGGGGAGVVVVVVVGVVDLLVQAICGLGLLCEIALLGLCSRLHRTFSGQSQKWLSAFHLSGGEHLNLNDSPSAQI